VFSEFPVFTQNFFLFETFLQQMIYLTDEDGLWVKVTNCSNRLGWLGEIASCTETH
jgi:hypothetical protein